MKKKLLVGPHHGEHTFPEYDDGGYSEKVTVNEIGYLTDDKEDWGSGNYIELKDLAPYFQTCEYLPEVKSEAEDCPWGHFTEIVLCSSSHTDEFNKTYGYKHWKSYIQKLMSAYFDAFINSGGDDDTFDYMPSFTTSIEQIMELLGYGEDIKRIRKACLCIMENREEAKSMEFFSDEELDEIFPKKQVDKTN